MFKTKERGSLAAWIDSALKVDTAIKTFAKNLTKDFDAVNNAVVIQYSNGQVEGQVNRLKNIKRRMYGKASFQMLRNMVVADTVKVAAHHLHHRGGVIIGDVVGLGKTITATALAKMFEDDFFLETLIICPKNLVEMWRDYAHK